MLLDSQNNELLDLLRRATRLFQARTHQFLRDHDLSMSKAWVLKALLINDRLSLVELSKLIDVSTSHTSGLVDALVRDGLVERARDESDRRVVWMSLSPLGKQQADEVSAQHTEYFKNVLKNLDAKEAEEIIQQLTKLVDVLENPPESEA